MQPDKVATSQFGTDEIEKLSQDTTLDAYLAVGPLDSKITTGAIAATSRSRGAPKFLAVEASEAIALRHPRYEAEEIPGSVFSANPAWPEDKVDTISVNHLILARKELSETKAAAFYRQLFAVRDAITQRVAGAAHITKPETEKEAEPSVHSGAAAVINGTERTFLDKYSDYFWFVLLILSGIGSAAAWLRRYLNRDERDDNTSHRNRILAVVSDVREARSEGDLQTSQREVDAIIGEALKCYDDGAIEQEDLAAFALVLELLDHAVAQRRAVLQGGLPDQGRTQGSTLASRRSEQLTRILIDAYRSLEVFQGGATKGLRRPRCRDCRCLSPGRPLLPDDQRSVISALVHAFRARNFLAYANVQTRP